MNSDQKQDELPSTGYVRQAFLLKAILPFSAATLWRAVQQNRFPSPVRLSNRVTAWRVEDIRTWMSSRPTVNVAASNSRCASAKTSF